MKSFQTATLIALLLLSKCRADFVVGYFYDYFTARGGIGENGIAVPLSDYCNCTAIRDGWKNLQAYAANGIFYKIPAGLCNYGYVLDFYYKGSPMGWNVVEDDSDPWNYVGWCVDVDWDTCSCDDGPDLGPGENLDYYVKNVCYSSICD